VQATLDANFLPTDMQFLAFLEKTTNAMYHLWNADSIGSVRLRFYALSQSNASKLQSQVLIACSFTIHSVAGIMNFPRYFDF